MQLGLKMNYNSVLWLLFALVGAASCQRFFVQRPVRRTQQSSISPDVLRLLSSLGVGGLVRNTGFQRPVAVRTPQLQTFTLSRPAPVISNGILRSQPQQPMLLQTMPSQQVGPSIMSRFDTPDTPGLPDPPESSRDLTRDRPEIVVAPRSMVRNARQAAAWQKLYEADGVVVM